MNKQETLSARRTGPSTLAPVGISTYARLDHLRQTVAALQANQLATASDVWFFSDAPRSGDEMKVAAVRDYLRTVAGFRSITIVERTSNNRVFNNRHGMRTLLEMAERMIWLEEDVVTSPGFLNYMNQALVAYRDDPRIMSVAGYMPPFALPDSYSDEVFFLRRFDAWGFGIWRDRFELLTLECAPLGLRLLTDGTLRGAFRRCGEDMLAWVKLDVAGRLDALDVKATLNQFFLNRLTVYPVGSLTQNIGCDGSGAHCANSNQHDVTLSNGRESWDFPAAMGLNEQVIEAHYLFRSGGTPLHSWKRRRRRVKELLTQYLLLLRDQFRL